MVDHNINFNYDGTAKVNFCAFLGIVEGIFRYPSTMPRSTGSISVDS